MIRVTPGVAGSSGLSDDGSGIESANFLGFTGQGRICGMATTRKETARQVVKRVEVLRERG